MDGIKDNQSRSNDVRSSGSASNRKRRLAGLALLATVVGGLHLVLFNALDVVAPLGIVNAENTLIVIEADRSPRPTFLTNDLFDQLVADAR